MNTQTSLRLLLGANVAIVIGFGAYYLQLANYEFLAYAGTIALVTLLLFSTLRFTQFSPGIVLGVTIWGLLHMLGGSVMTSDGVLYAYRIFPFFDGGGDFYILKMDQVIHAYLYGVVGLMCFHLLTEIIGIKTHTVLVAFIAVFAAAGISTLNEIIEFLAAVNLPETGVGGYHNTVLDMVFNLTGAALAVTAKLLFSKSV